MSAHHFVLGTNADGGDVFVDLPELVESRMLITAMSGGGKSTAIRRVLEQTYGRIQHIVIDPEGEFGTLREKFDYVIAGKGGDCAADPKSARLLARKVLELGISIICDISEVLESTSRATVREQQQLFVQLFVTELVAVARTAGRQALLVIDEAHLFAPEGAPTASAKAVIDACSLGRKRGLVPILATQRLSKLSKDAAAELGNNLIGMTTLDVDVRRAADVLGMSKPEAQRQLRALKSREFYAYGRALEPGVQQILVGDVETTLPRGGQRLVAPPAPSQKVRDLLSKLTDLPEQAAEEARTVDEFKRQVAELRRELQAARSQQRVETAPCDYETEIAHHASVIAQQQERITTLKNDAVHFWRLHGTAKEAIDAAAHVLNEASTALARAEIPAPAAPVKRSAVGASAGGERAATGVAPKAPKAPEPAGAGEPIDFPVRLKDSAITPPRQRILDAIAAFEPLGLFFINKSIVAAYARISPKSSGFANNLGAMRSAGYIDYPSGGMVCLTELGRSKAAPAESIHRLSQLHEAWVQLLPKPRAAIIEALIEVYPEALDKATLAERAGVSETSSGYANNLGGLRTLGLLEYPQPGHVVATELLFPKGVPV